MFGNDLLLSFAFMAILFLRQIAILKQANKINYAPLMVGIGLISSIVHFIIHPEAQNFVLLLRESFFPLLVSLLLYIVMNIMHQTQEKENNKIHDEFSRIMVEQVTQLKEFMSELEGRLTSCQQDDRAAQEEIRIKFKEDIQALDSIQTNQKKFLGMFQEMDEWHQNVSHEFEEFTDTQMPKLSSILHEHIDILRVSEQDHYNKIKIILEKAGASRVEIADDMDDVKESLKKLQGIADTVAQSITKHTLQQLSGVTKSFEKEISSLKSHSQSIETSLQESENTLDTIREKSELIMKQMVLSANRMDSLSEKNTGLHDVYTSIKELMLDMEVIKADYVKAQAQLSVISNELKSSENEQIETMREQIENLGTELTKSIDESLSKLHEHYHIADGEVTQSVQILAKKAQLQRGYTELDS
ncbi:MAG: DNA repair exonuclease SbcCD ATPase subunit [Sulfurimonas sp.]|jgi:DNA repair exonuclease SbcCD ATPase subunit|uniref:hypothetical protein n=1 Tax=Sulfurimonas sp. TaxID=2022749 RepID=UPI0039E59246